MFSECQNLTSIDVSNFNTENVVRMNNMFYSCYSLTSLDLSSFNTKKVNSFYSMFYYCRNLRNVDISSFTLNNDFYLFSGLPDSGTLIIKSEYKDRIRIIPSTWTIKTVD